MDAEFINSHEVLCSTDVVEKSSIDKAVVVCPALAKCPTLHCYPLFLCCRLPHAVTVQPLYIMLASLTVPSLVPTNTRLIPATPTPACSPVFPACSPAPHLTVRLTPHLTRRCGMSAPAVPSLTKSSAAATRAPRCVSTLQVSIRLLCLPAGCPEPHTCQT